LPSLTWLKQGNYVSPHKLSNEFGILIKLIIVERSDLYTFKSNFDKPIIGQSTITTSKIVVSSEPCKTRIDQKHISTFQKSPLFWSCPELDNSK
jgi:hypothetical protein